MRVVFSLLFCLFVGQALFAQQPNRQQLEKQRAALLREISATQEQLTSTKKDRKASLSQLRAINSKLRARQQLIGTINYELGNINSDIGSLRSEIQVMNNNLETLKLSYAQSVRYAYKHRTSESLILFLFSADNFNDAVRRMQYLKKYRDYRKKQAEDIRKAKSKIDDKIAVLSGKKVEKAGLLKTEENQQTKIVKEKLETDKMVQELKGREGELMSEIRKNQQTANRIQAAIKAEIQKEIEIARKKAEEEARRKAEEQVKREAAEKQAREKAEAEARRRAVAGGGTYKAGSQTVRLNTGRPGSSDNQKPKTESDKPDSKASGTTATEVTPPQPSYKLSLTPEVQALSNSFAANKGKLPWPVASGYISGVYGRHPHPVYHNVMVENNGVDIATYPSAPVRAVFSGKVIKVTNINGFVVMISHGEYFTVYSNLATVSVKVGQTISTKQAIGTAGINYDGESMINFQIWQVGNTNNSSTVDPSLWIAQ